MVSDLGRVLVTGGCGFIGSNLVRALQWAGWDVVVLDNLSTGSYKNLNGFKVPLYVGDIRDYHQSQILEVAFEGVDVVVHLAAVASVPDSFKKPQEAWDVNVSGTYNLLEMCHKKQIKHFVFASTQAVLGSSIYGLTKLAGEQFCESYKNTFGLQTVALRISNVYGHNSGDKGVIPLFMKLIAEDKPITIYGGGEQTRDYVHVFDVCNAIMLAVKYGEGVYNIGSGVSISVNTLVQILREVTQKAIIAGWEKQRTGDILHNVVDISKAREALGYEPFVDLKVALRRYWAKRMHHVILRA